jgi:hypothetical protein
MEAKIPSMQHIFVQKKIKDIVKKYWDMPKPG